MLHAKFKVSFQGPPSHQMAYPHPYWCSAQDGYWIIVAYADDEAQIKELWPEAFDLVSESCDGYIFTDRFPKPQWFEPLGETAQADL